VFFLLNGGSKPRLVGEIENNGFERFEDAQNIKNFVRKRCVVATDRVMLVFQHHETPVAADYIA
jgi:hypothetical protein